MTLEQRKKIIDEIIKDCYSRIAVKNKSDAAILGYCIELAYTIAIYEDGSFWVGFLRNKNKEQSEAENLVRKILKERSKKCLIMKNF